MVVDGQQQIDELSQLRGDVSSKFEFGNGRWNGLFELIICSTANKWWNSMNKLVDKDSKSPDISFLTVSIVNNPFRGHKEGRAYVQIFESFPI